MMSSPRDFLRQFQRVANAHDLEATLAMIADDAIFFYDGEPPHIGKDAIRHAIAHHFSITANEKVRAHHVTWLYDNGEFAMCTYLFDWTAEIGGTMQSGKGRGTTALRRVGEEWRIVHEHSSDAPV
jgi:ketosteroid isomerase-like protein